MTRQPRFMRSYPAFWGTARSLGLAAEGAVAGLVRAHDHSLTCPFEILYGEPLSGGDQMTRFRVLVVVVGVLGVVATGCIPPTNPTTTTTTTVAPGPDAVQVDAGEATCAVLADQTVSCWGGNGNGLLGDGAASGFSDVPISVPGLTGVRQVSVGTSACAVLLTGEVKCWGSNSFGELGNGTPGPISTPVEVVGISDATEVSVGNGFACAIVSGGAVKCWGAGHFGTLGNGFVPFTTQPVSGSAVPVDVIGLSGVTAISAGVVSACAISSGQVYCWGLQADGALGNGEDWFENLDALQWMPIPQQVIGISDANSVGVGFDHACASLNSGSIECWGYGANGELGNGIDSSNAAPPASSVPVGVTGITDAASVTVGWNFACAALADGTGKCWGNNSLGALGASLSQSNSNVPVTVLGLTDGAEVSSGSTHSCALITDGRLRCWGNSLAGTLGNGPNVAADGEQIVDVYGIP